ncbi:sensor histidine kinase YesM [Paenibacillus glycanilyticus]|uniref:histidine kinase n=2 Tax=Paenibacillus glycanilyticus TaxID=126569 RepID=A0ABQ6NUD4_9BACL|nr:sensor histidine kinase [Paenibacillus glycanilyticus]GMK48641.1 sensor histidine kinase YesM [Paenibacillus glycanilyticus]
MFQFNRMNTLRNQIFLGFVLVMLLVLASVGFFTYGQVSELLRNNAENHIQQTAVQATGKMDVLLHQMETFTMQVATNASIQSLMAKEAGGTNLTFEERQVLQHEIRKQQAYVSGVQSIELYSNGFRVLFPLTDISLYNRVPNEWIREADRAAGQLVWFGIDKNNPNQITAIRRVRLIDQSFSNAGYLLVRIDKKYFELIDANTSSDGKEEMGLIDGSGQIIAANFSADIPQDVLQKTDGKTISMHGRLYIPIQKQLEAAAGWKVLILTPAEYAAEGVSVLRTAILVSVMVGVLLFLILTFILSTMITSPILNLIKAMRGAKYGSLKPIPVTSSTLEINELNNTYNQMVAYLNELIEVVYEKEIIQSRTELKALQAQINPHFLFNTLEALYWALEDKEEEELSQVVVAMSGLFRYVINRADDDEWVTVADELEHAERYLKIMEMRLIDRLKWSIEGDESLRGVPIPKLLIQPLVENAISHGVEQRIGQGSVVIGIEKTERPGYIRISVTDNGPGMSFDKVQSLYAAMKQGHVHDAKGNGVGISNVDRRLRLYYGEETQGLQIQSEQGAGTRMSFEIPIEHGGEANEDDSDRRR